MGTRQPLQSRIHPLPDRGIADPMAQLISLSRTTVANRFNRVFRFAEMIVFSGGHGKESGR